MWMNAHYFPNAPRTCWTQNKEGFSFQKKMSKTFTLFIFL